VVAHLFRVKDSMTVTFDQPKTFTTLSGESKQFSSVIVERIADLPIRKIIRIYITEIGFIRLNALSDNNYDNPPWTNEMIIEAVRNL